MQAPNWLNVERRTTLDLACGPAALGDSSQIWGSATGLHYHRL
jgi:hypothetical protein